jgi:ubiquinone/menaquinone biosynthesis C-methylase UbiE
MLERAKRRARRLGIALDSHVASADLLPFPDGSLDAAILHLILAVVPDPVAALKEVARVLRRGGRVTVLDKFVARGARPSLARRALDRVFRPILTGFVLDLYEIVAAVPALTVTHDEPSLAGGVWRIARLERR